MEKTKNNAKIINIIGKNELDGFLKRRRTIYSGEKRLEVEEIISTVRREGDLAVAYYTKKFDGADLKTFEVKKETLRGSKNKIDKKFLAVLEGAAENIREFHAKQLSSGFEIKRESGEVLGQRYTPISKAGIYVPGGSAAYPSTALMNIIPAKIAGVGEINVATPPGKNGEVRPEILAACVVAGADRVFTVGGAQALAAFAYGTETLPKVDKITGPGNIYVALAKRELFGVVGVDMIAGPSEILVVADENASPEYIAADMLSQAEHDMLASAILVTPSKALAEEVATKLEELLLTLPRRGIAEESLKNYGAIIIAGSLDECAEISNIVSPEHLEICADDCFGLFEKISSAGSVFLGGYTPEAVGDYLAGPNHTLPTGGSARFSSPLSPDDFRKKTSYIYYPESALARVADSAALFARAEGLEAHARAVEARFIKANKARKSKEGLK
ncbi:MAG: histidinol dehydrogenase [Eubacteriales bacterium]